MLIPEESRFGFKVNQPRNKHKSPITAPAKASLSITIKFCPGYKFLNSVCLVFMCSLLNLWLSAFFNLFPNFYLIKSFSTRYFRATSSAFNPCTAIFALRSCSASRLKDLKTGSRSFSISGYFLSTSPRIIGAGS